MKGQENLSVWSIKNSGEVINKFKLIPCDEFVNL